MTFLDLSKANEQKKVSLGNGWLVYMKGGVVHREDGPAVISPIHQEWFVNGKHHRDNGPAVMHINHPISGKFICEWHFNGECKYVDTLDEETFNEYLHKEMEK